MMLRTLLAALAILAAPPAFALDKPRDWEPPKIDKIPNHREQWREVVDEISAYAKKRKPDFVVLVHNGAELFVKGEREAEWEEARDPAGKDFEKRLPLGTVMRPFIKNLDGVVLDGLYCGPFKFEKPLAEAIRERRELDATLADERKRGIVRPPVPLDHGPFSLDPKEEIRKYEESRRNALRAEHQRRIVYAAGAMIDAGRRLLAIETCATQAEAEAANKSADRDRVLAFVSVDNRALDRMPTGHPRYENPAPVTTLGEARNWLALPKGDRFPTRAAWVMAIEDTNYDAVLVDVSHRGTDLLVKSDVYRMHFKKLGAPRLALAVVPVGRAHDWRWYWQKGWTVGAPAFLRAPDEPPGTFLVDVADKSWRETLGKTVVGVMDLGFDGIVIDDVDTYRWFEELMPIKD